RPQNSNNQTGREPLLEREPRARMDRKREPIERRSPCVDALGEALFERPDIQGDWRLTRTDGGPRAQDQLGQRETGDDETSGQDGQAVDGAQQRERRDESSHAQSPAQRAPPTRLAATRPSLAGPAFLQSEADE